MARNLAQELIEAHLVEGDTHPEETIALKIDQMLRQETTGTLVMLMLVLETRIIHRLIGSQGATSGVLVTSGSFASPFQAEQASWSSHAQPPIGCPIQQSDGCRVGYVDPYTVVMITTHRAYGGSNR